MLPDLHVTTVFLKGQNFAMIHHKVIRILSPRKPFTVIVSLEFQKGVYCSEYCTWVIQ
jgi:hypothetical protein